MLSEDENLLAECCEAYQKAALSLDSRNEEGFYKWGTALLQWAILQGSRGLYLESIEKFRIARELNQDREQTAKNMQYAHRALMRLNIEEILNDYREKQHDTKNSQNNTRMIPVKGCLCGYINPCERTTCKQCGNSLGKAWGDDRHISAGVCEKCGKYVGIMGNACPKCGDEVPYHYEDFFNGNIKNAWKN
jgi:tetratricopeptide (TPR) repeat protein